MGRRLKSVKSSVVIVAVVLLGGCTLFDFSQLRVTTFPSDRNQVLETSVESLWVEWSEGVLQTEAERIVRLSSEAGTVEIDGSWDGNRYTIEPLERFQEGLRYVLSVEGDVRTADGRRFSEFISIPFFVGSTDPPPALLSSAPESGAFVTSEQSISLEFSAGMARKSVETAFSVSPDTKVNFIWSADSRVASVTPAPRWDNGILYTWTVSSEAEDQRGTAMLGPRSGSFLVEDDLVAPTVMSVTPAFPIDGAGTPFDPLPGMLSDLTGGEAIRIEFSEAMDSDSALSAIRLDPEPAGVMIPLSPSVYAFSPEENWNRQTEYVLTVGEEARDVVGNQLVAEYREVFTVATPPQTVTSVTVSGSLTASQTFFTADLVTGTEWELPWDTVPELTVILAIDFQLPYETSKAKTRIASNIRVDALFPPGLASPTLTAVTWPSDQELELTFESFTRSVDPQINYYNVRFPTTQAQSQTDDGSFLESEYELILRSGS
jgi:hypothetical protein